MLKNKSWTAHGTHWGLLLLALLLVMAGISGSATPSAAAPPTQGQDDAPVVIELPPEAFDTSLKLGQQPTKKAARVDPALSDLIVALQTSVPGGEDIRPGMRPNPPETRIQTQVALDPRVLETVTEAISKAGGEVTGVSTDQSRIQAWLPTSIVSRIADMPGVHMIRQPDKAVPLQQGLGMGSTTEALEAMNVPAWHAAGQIGAWIRVGVIDTGFEGYTSLLGTELPTYVVARNFVDGESQERVDGTTPHGTACAEIVYDVAPGVQLYLAKVSTDIDLQEAVAWLVSQNVDVISTSLTWYNVTPGDGTGVFADLVRDARYQGVLWVTAAGNDRENHWNGTYVDIDPGNNGPDGEWHKFTHGAVNCFGPEGDTTCYEFEAGELLRVFLRWDDWTQADQDYDLYLVRWNGQTWETVARSLGTQAGGPADRPTESITAVASGAPAAYGFSISRFYSTRNVNLEVFAPKMPGLRERQPARSLGNLADAPGAITVAAVDVDYPYDQEPYSAQGPTNGLGGTADGGFTKPDIAAYANVSAEGYGVRGFDGTSAATPHVAGAAALVWGLNPHFSPDEVQAFLESRALDLGAPGLDTVYGYGRLYLGEHSLAPVVTSITPNAGVYTGPIRITRLTGQNFRAGATVHLSKSNHSPITGTNVAWIDENTLSLDLDLTGTANGTWDVVVTNPDGKTGVLPDGFTVAPTQTAPRISGITPPHGTGIVDVILVGQNFAGNGAVPSVRLTKVGQDDIVATQVSVVDSSTLTCRFDLTGANGGLWNVVVTNPNGDYWTLSEGFEVVYWLYLPHIVKDYTPPLLVVKDTMVSESAPEMNYDALEEMWAGYDQCQGMGITRSLLKFDTSGIAPGTPIHQATLWVFLKNTCDVPDRSRTVTLHRAYSIWTSETVTWTTQPAIGTAIDSVLIPPQQTDPRDWYGFDVTELVQGWVNGDYLNLGVVLRGPEGFEDGASLAFYTRDDPVAGETYMPRILFSNPSQGTAAEPLSGKPDCIPENDGQGDPNSGAYQLLTNRVCSAD